MTIIGTAVETLNILIVDNDQVDLIAFRRMVVSEGLPYECRFANSVEQAVALLNENTFDLVVTDYDLGDGTGFEVMQAAGSTPTIFITGRGNESVAVQAMKSGAYDYLTKDDERQYLPLLPLVITNAVNRRKTELEAREFMAERIRRQTLEDFIRDASHDLRTPLTVLSSSHYLLKKLIGMIKTDFDAVLLGSSTLSQRVQQMEERTASIAQATDNLERIVADMLYMVAVDSARQLTMVRGDLSALVYEVVQKFERYAREKNQSLIFHSASRPLPVLASDTEFASIVRNLIKNGLDYTPHGGRVTVSTELRSLEAVLIVQDTGEGIPQDELPHIFRRFYRIDKARPTESGSTGLGLAIVQRLVELHQGRIEVESVEGAGSIFRVYFPISHRNEA